jgi:hypothetical protein
MRQPFRLPLDPTTCRSTSASMQHWIDRSGIAHRPMHAAQDMNAQRCLARRGMAGVERSDGPLDRAASRRRQTGRHGRRAVEAHAAVRRRRQDHPTRRAEIAPWRRLTSLILRRQNSQSRTCSVHDLTNTGHESYNTDCTPSANLVPCLRLRRRSRVVDLRRRRARCAPELDQSVHPSPTIRRCHEGKPL